MELDLSINLTKLKRSLLAVSEWHNKLIECYVLQNKFLLNTEIIRY